MHFLYLALILFTISYPLLKSFENKIKFYRGFRFLFPAIIIIAVFFIAWDILFTYLGVWKFNPAYVLGSFIAGLPLEEWLFFFTVPFACVFIYEVANHFIKTDPLHVYSRQISAVLIGLLILLLLIFREHSYTVVITSLLAGALFIHQFILRSPWLGKFYIAWSICILPFLLVNGVLTAMPVVIYRSEDIMPFRIWTIPVEDLFYGMLNILLVISVYEWLKTRASTTVKT